MSTTSDSSGVHFSRTEHEIHQAQPQPTATSLMAIKCADLEPGTHDNLEPLQAHRYFHAQPYTNLQVDPV